MNIVNASATFYVEQIFPCSTGVTREDSSIECKIKIEEMEILPDLKTFRIKINGVELVLPITSYEINRY